MPFHMKSENQDMLYRLYRNVNQDIMKENEFNWHTPNK